MAVLFVTVEGIDRSGNTTLARTLVEALGDRAGGGARTRRGGRPLRGRGCGSPGAGARRLRADRRGRAGEVPARGGGPPGGGGPRRRARARVGRSRGSAGRVSAPVKALEGTEDHPHARMVLGGALRGAALSHAYLFHGPPGTGKRTAARALAAELLSEGEPDPDAARARVRAETHPDLTWVRPTGAHVMRVSDVDEPVVAAATRTPFEAARRVFVLEGADTMNDEVANRMLKTLEEPADYVHLVLLTDALGQVLETVVSRCQLVRFDPLPEERIEAILVAEGAEPAAAAACARLALGNLTRARYLVSDEGGALRDDVEALVRAALAGGAYDPRAGEPWAPLLARAEARRAAAEADVERAAKERPEPEPRG